MKSLECAELVEECRRILLRVQVYVSEPFTSTSDLTIPSNSYEPSLISSTTLPTFNDGMDRNYAENPYRVAVYLSKR